MEAIVKGEILINKKYVTKEMLKAYTYKQSVFGREYTKKIRNYRKNGDTYFFPRDLQKFRSHLSNKFKYSVSIGREINFNMKFKPLDRQVKPINEIIDKFKSNLNVLFQAATRFGKTYSVVNVINKLKTNTLVIVDKKLLVTQFINDTKEYSDASISELTAKSVKDYDKSSDIYITTFQFLYANKLFLEEISEDFGMVVVDECHSLVAGTYRDVLYRFNSRYRLGISATPTSKSQGLTPLITDSFEKVKVVGTYKGITVDVYKYRLPKQYTLDLTKPISPQYSEYFLWDDVSDSVLKLIEKFSTYKIMLAIPNQTVQNHYADLCRSIGLRVGVMNSEPNNLKVKDETLNKFNEGEIDIVVGLGQLLKGVSAPIEVIIDFFAVGNQEATEQLLGRARTEFKGRKCSKYIQLVSKYSTRKNDKVENYLSNLEMSNMRGDICNHI